MKRILDEKLHAKVSIMEVCAYDPYRIYNRKDVVKISKNGMTYNSKELDMPDYASKTYTMFIVYKNEKGEKRVKVVPNPSIDIFFTKPEYRSDWTTAREYIEMDKVYPVNVKYNQVVNTVYKEACKENDPATKILVDVYNKADMMHQSNAKKEILKWQHAFMADLDVQDYYRIMLGYQYDTMHYHIINKCFLDIESDVYGLTSGEMDMDLDPTNACTLIFDFDMNVSEKKKPQVFTFLLRNHKKYPQQKKFEDNLDKFVKQCHDEFDHQSIVKGNKTTTIDVCADYHIKLFDDESELLTAIFKVINYYKPDLCAVWNIAYDLPKLRARMEHHNIDHVHVMCDPMFPKPTRFVEMNIDNRGKLDIADRKTYIKMASTTRYVDQMQTYASIRKGRKAYGSNKLDNIAGIELGVGKRTFEKGIDVTNAPIKDYWNFVLYNIRDVWCQVLIDRVTNDMMTLIYDSNQAGCSIENLTKQTQYQKQIYYTCYLRKGFVPGSNINNNYIKGITDKNAESLDELKRKRDLRRRLDDDDYDEDDEIQEIVVDTLEYAENVYEDGIDRKIALTGGIVGDPNLNSMNGTELIEGISSKHTFDDCDDMDYASEYPWAKVTRSISRSTQYGRLIISKKISDRQNVYDEENYIPGSEFTADYISQDIMSLGNVWFNLPTLEEVLAKLST